MKHNLKTKELEEQLKKEYDEQLNIVENSAAFKEAESKLKEAESELLEVENAISEIQNEITKLSQFSSEQEKTAELRAKARSKKQRASFLSRRIKTLRYRLIQIKKEFNRKIRLLQTVDVSLERTRQKIDDLKSQIAYLEKDDASVQGKDASLIERSKNASEGKLAQLEKALSSAQAKKERLEQLKAQLEHAPDQKNILEVYNIKKHFPIKTNFFGKVKQSLKAVDNVSIEVPYGCTLGIVGESGCGKTTMGRVILRLHELTDGRIIFKGMDITSMKGKALRKLRPEMQVIFQDPYSSLSPRLTVGEIIGEGVKAHKLVPKSEHYDYILGVMKKCGLQEIHYNRFPHEFSGGQRQRICIARALAMKPDFVVCDEPVSALDVSIQAQIINLLKDLQTELKLAYLFISHDLSVIKHISDIVGVMYLGNVVESGDKTHIFSNPLHPYTKALLSAVPVPDPKTKMNRIVLKGDIPSPANPPAGCKFHTRCDKCMEICKSQVPHFREVEKGHKVACHLYKDKTSTDIK